MSEILNKWPDVPPMSLQFEKIAYKSQCRGKASNGAEFWRYVPKRIDFPGFLRGGKVRVQALKSARFRDFRKTQNPVVAIPCGFDPRFQHQILTARKPLIYQGLWAVLF